MGKKGRAKRKIDPELQAKIKSKMSNLKFKRSTGAIPQMNSLNISNEDMEMVKDMQKDMGNLRGRKAKKYANNLMSGMDEDQTKNMATLANQNMPGKSKEISKLVNNSTKSKQVKEEKKSKVNSETVYKPSSKLTEEEKEQKMKNPRKKQKTFAKVNIHVPKINELKSLNSVSNTSGNLPPPKISGKPGSISDIDSLFITGPTPSYPEYVFYEDRVKNINDFAENLEDSRKQDILMFAHERDLYVVKDCTRFPKCEYVKVPDSRKKITYEEYAKIKDDDQFYFETKKNNVLQFTNCAKECNEFAKKFDFIEKLVKYKRCSFQWLTEELNRIGIVHKANLSEKVPSEKNHIWQETFYLLCHEYKKKPEPTVAEIPFCKIFLIAK